MRLRLDKKKETKNIGACLTSPVDEKSTAKMYDDLETYSFHLRGPFKE